jgi:hypothetical protein
MVLLSVPNKVKEPRRRLLLFYFKCIPRVKSRVVEFLTVFDLLLAFEFVTLLLHPYIALWCHDIPVLMLLVLVAIAAFLVPLQEKLETVAKAHLCHPGE